MTEKLSLVIPTFDRGYVLARAIQSVFAQDCSPQELVIVDDGSTDDTEAVVKQFWRPELKYVRHDANRGVAAARNTGVRASAGGLIGFLDSDDVLSPGTVCRLTAALKDHPKVDCAFCDVSIAKGIDGQPWTTSLARRMRRFSTLIPQNPSGDLFIVSQRSMYLCLLEEVPIKPSALMFRRSAFSQTGSFREDLRSGEDWEWLLRLARFADFAFVDDPLVRQFHLNDATHQTMRESDLVGAMKWMRNEQKLVLGDEEAHAAATRGIRKTAQDLGNHYRSSGNNRAAFQTYMHGFRFTHDSALALRAALAWLPGDLPHQIRGSQQDLSEPRQDLHA
jgi:glycosyltransferase involved in cell wall biosynthesis